MSEKRERGRGREERGERREGGGGGGGGVNNYLLALNLWLIYLFSLS